MKLYRFFDTVTIAASSHEEFASRLWLGSFSPAKSLDDYMEEFADRAYRAMGDFVSTRTGTDFTDSLIRNGYVTVFDTLN